MEVFKAKTRRPSIERTDRRDFPARRVMPFAESGCAVAAEPQHLRDRRHLGLPEPVVTREIAFADSAESHSMVIATGEQRCACRGTQCRRMEVVVA